MRIRGVVAFVKLRIAESDSGSGETVRAGSVIG
jgi:hypothetical protein